MSLFRAQRCSTSVSKFIDCSSLVRVFFPSKLTGSGKTRRRRRRRCCTRPRTRPRRTRRPLRRWRHWFLPRPATGRPRFEAGSNGRRVRGRTTCPSTSTTTTTTTTTGPCWRMTAGWWQERKSRINPIKIFTASIYSTQSKKYWLKMFT